MHKVKASAYVSRGRLVVIGVANLRVGPVPFTYTCVVEGVPDGPVDIGQKTLPDTIEKGLAESQVDIQRQVRIGAIKLGAENLVLRARQGDQNAMAILIEMRNKAEEGSRKAKRALLAVKRYIEDNPPTKSCDFGHEQLAKREMSVALAKHLESDIPQHYCSAVLTLLPHCEPVRAIFILTKGPLIDQSLLEAVAAGMSDRSARQFLNGYETRQVSSEAGQLGACFREAAAIQRVQRGKPIKELCPIAAWELGE